MEILPIIFALISMFGFGLSNAMSQKPIKKIGITKTLFYRNLFTSSILLFTLFFFKPSFSLSMILLTIFLSLIGYISLFSFFKALKIGKVGIVSPISNSSLIFTIIFALIFYGEEITIKKIISILLILVGIILISFNPKHLKILKGVSFALITCILWGLIAFISKIPVQSIGPILTSFIIEFGIFIINLLQVRKEGISLKGYSLSNIILISIFGVMGILFFNIGIKTSNVSLIAPITYANPLVAVLYARLIYKEKLNLRQYIAILIIILGIVTLSII